MSKGIADIAFCSRKSSHLINKVQERALRLITNDYQSSFNILLGKCNEFSIHQQNLQTLMIELLGLRTKYRFYLNTESKKISNIIFNKFLNLQHKK